MKKYILIFLYPLTGLFYWLSGFVPRDKNVWVFGSYGNAFNDNSKYLFIHVLDKNPEIKAIWISGDQDVVDRIRQAGGVAYRRWSLRGLVASLRGGLWFVSAYVSDINYYCSRGVILTNLWHGIPLKNIEFDIKSGPLAKLFNSPTVFEKNILKAPIFRRPQFILSTAEGEVSRIFESAFRVDSHSSLCCGYPRTDIFFYNSTRWNSIVTRWESRETMDLLDKIGHYKECYIYMPTWRDSQPDFMANSGWNFVLMNEELVKRGAILVIKLHAATPEYIISLVGKFSNIHVMKSNEDVYSILPLTSALISDYSSIIFDYLLLNKPIYYYSFDLISYLSDSRGMYYDYDKVIAGRQIDDPMMIFDDELEVVASAYSEVRRELRMKLFQHADEFSASRVVDSVKGLVS